MLLLEGSASLIALLMTLSQPPIAHLRTICIITLVETGCYRVTEDISFSRLLEMVGIPGGGGSRALPSSAIMPEENAPARKFNDVFIEALQAPKPSHVNSLILCYESIIETKTIF